MGKSPPDEPSRRWFIKRTAQAVGGGIAVAALAPAADAVEQILTQGQAAPRMRGPLKPGKWVLIAGDSFAAASGGGIPPGMYAAAKLGLGSVVIATDGAGLGTLMNQQLKQVAGLVEKYGPPAAVIISCGGDDPDIDASVAEEHEIAFPVFDEAGNARFVRADKRLPPQVNAAAIAFSRAAGGNKRGKEVDTLWQGYPDDLEGEPPGPFLSTQEREQNMERAFTGVNAAIALGIKNSGPKASFVPMWSILDPYTDVNLPGGSNLAMLENAAQADGDLQLLGAERLIQDADTWMQVPGALLGVGGPEYSHPDHPNASGSKKMGKALVEPLAEATGLTHKLSPLGR